MNNKQPFWVTLVAAPRKRGIGVCIEAKDEAEVRETLTAITIAGRMAPDANPTVQTIFQYRHFIPKAKIDRIPYAASPLLGDSGSWTLCHSPERCLGRTSCPMMRACSE